MIEIFIVEDEQSIQEELLILLQQRSDVKVIGTAKSVKESVSKLSKLSPDLLFMDIQLEDGLSFSIFEQLPEISCGVVFITAFDSYALKAIKLSAFDYLLKPINEQELNDTIDHFNRKAHLYTSSKKQSENLTNVLNHKENEKQIIVKTNQKTHLIQQKDIAVCKGDGNYTTFYLSNEKKITCSKPLKYYRELMSEKYFIQTHQSYVVNKNFIEQIDASNQLILSIELFPIPISVRRKKDVIKTINA